MIAIENEILVTLVASLVVLVITIFQIWAMSRAKSRHHQRMLELENSLNQAETPKALSAKRSCALLGNGCYLMQVIFGLFVFVGFTCWAIYLVSLGFVEWAPLPGSLALIALMTPIIAWRGCKHRHQALNRQIQEIEACRKAGCAEDAKAAQQPEAPVVAWSEPTPEPEKAAETFVSRQEATSLQVKGVTLEKQSLPQDSILRRHFLSHLRSQIESCYPAHPTDSILKRHFAHFIATEMEKYIERPACRACHGAHAKPSDSAATPAESSVSASACCHAKKMAIPQDSVLRRHFLTQLRFDVEADFPSRPSDSILKRHYEQLIMIKMAARMEELGA